MSQSISTAPHKTALADYDAGEIFGLAHALEVL